MICRRTLKLGIAFISLLAAAGAQAATATSTVSEVWTYGNGGVIVTGFNFGQSGCTNSHGFLIPASNPNLQKILAVVLAARATGARLQVNATVSSGCWYPEVLPDASSYVAMLPD